VIEEQKQDVNLETIAPQIAAALGDGWDTDPQSDESNSYRDRCATLVHPSGRKLYLNKHTREKRISVGCGWLYVDGRQMYPRDYMTRDAWDKAVTSINVGLAKSPEQMAKDITRRLLPGYAEMWAALEQRRDEQLRTHVEAVDLARAIASALGKEDWDVEKRMRDGEARIYGAGVDFHVRATGGVKVEGYSLTREQALQLAVLVATWKKDDE